MLCKCNSRNQTIGYLGKNHVNKHSVRLDFEILCPGDRRNVDHKREREIEID